MKNGLIYSRVSTQEQAQKGQSIEGQISLCKEYAKKNEIRIAKNGIYKDKGKTATNTNRPALQALLERVTDDKIIDCVLVLDTDRIARNTLDHLSIKSILKKHQVELISISQPLIDSSPEGNFIDTVLAATNALQSQITGRKTSKIMEEKAKAGYWPSIAPKGYQNITNHNPTNIYNKRIITPHPEESKLITQLFKKYATGKYNLKNIAKEMYRLGLKSDNNKIIQASVIDRILNHQLYYGVVPWKGKIYEGKHKPLINKPTWNACQQVLADHNQHASRSRKHDYLLRGFLYCADCGSRFWGGPHRGRNKIYHYYFCKKCMKGTYVKTKNMEKQVEKLFKKVKMSKTYSEELLETAREVIKEQRLLTITDKKALVNQQTKIDKQIREAEDRLLDKTLTPEQFKRIYGRLEARQTEIGEELRVLSDDYSQKFENIKGLVEMAINIHQTYKKAYPELKRSYLGLFFEKILIKDGKIKEALPSKAIKPLLKNGKIAVQVVSNWLPGLDSNQ